MHSRFNLLSNERLPPITVSLLLHGLLGSVTLVTFFGGSRFEFIDFEVEQMEPIPPQPIRLTPIPKKAPPKPKVKPRSVFGQSRKALVDPQSNVSVKAGNTIAKEVDDKKLKADDPDALPIPTEDYLVSQMPVLINERRIPYPPEARKNGVQGPVVMDLLIDAKGKVRKVDFIQGPGSGLNEAAVNAIRDFRFRPAKLNGRATAVRIRYIYRFILER